MAKAIGFIVPVAVMTGLLYLTWMTFHPSEGPTGEYQPLCYGHVGVKAYYQPVSLQGSDRYEVLCKDGVLEDVYFQTMQYTKPVAEADSARRGLTENPWR